MLRENSFMFYEWEYFIPGNFNNIAAKKLVCVENILELILQEN